MKLAEERTSVLRRYILGISEEDEQHEIELEMARDQSLFEELRVAESDLLDAYAAGELSTAERAAVEDLYLASDPGRRRVAFARALHSRAVSHARPAGRSGSGRWLIAATVGLVAVGTTLLLWQNRRLRSDLAGLRAEQDQSARQGQVMARQVEESRVEIARLREQLERAVAGGQNAAATIAKLLLRSGLVRDGAGMPSLALATEVEWAELELPAPEETHGKYVLTLETPEGRALWQSDPIAASATAKSLTVRVPTTALEDGTVIATLSGLAAKDKEEPVAEYVFVVRRARR